MLTAWNALPILDRLFDDVMNGTAGTSFGASAPQRSFVPNVDVRSNPDEIVFHFDVPGLKQEDIEITLDATTLAVRGQRTFEGSEKDQVWLGRSYGRFEKAFTLPDLVDPDGMTAELADGVLTIRIPKRPQAKPRRIQIGSGRKELTAKNE